MDPLGDWLELKRAKDSDEIVTVWRRGRFEGMKLHDGINMEPDLTKWVLRQPLKPEERRQIEKAFREVF